MMLDNLKLLEVEVQAKCAGGQPCPLYGGFAVQPETPKLKP